MLSAAILDPLPDESEAMTLLRLPRRSRGWDTADTSVPPCRGTFDTLRMLAARPLTGKEISVLLAIGNAEQARSSG